MKTHDLERVTAAGREILYFYEYARNDRNGNARYRVWIIDPARGAVYEKVFMGYRAALAQRVQIFIEREAGENGRKI